MCGDGMSHLTLYTLLELYYGCLLMPSSNLTHKMNALVVHSKGV